MLLSFKLNSPIRRSLVITRLLCVIALFSFTYCGGLQDAAAQFDGIDGGDLGGIDGGGIDGGGVDGGDLGGIDGGGLGGITGGGGLGTGGIGGLFGDNFGNAFGEETVDERNQGFVGPTSTFIQDNGFVGPPGPSSPQGEGSFGGGTNNVGGGGGGGGGGNNQNNNTGFGGTGEIKGFQVFRSGVRANLRPRFTSPQVSGFQTADRFQNRIRRIPNMANDGGGVQISISNQTATIQGFVGSFEERSRIERQLRLEPGVYRINNQAQVIGR